MVAELNNTFGERLPVLRQPAALRARQAVARLAVHGPRSAVPLRVLRAGETVYARIEVIRTAACRFTPFSPAAPRADEPGGRALPRPLSAHAAPSDGAHPLERGQALGQARAVPAQAAVRARTGLDPAMTTVDRDLPRSGTRPSSVLGRAAMAVLERVLRESRRRARLPDGSERRYGSAQTRVSMRIDDWRLLERIARTPKLALGESFQAGEWRSDDLVSPRAASAQRRCRAGAPPGMATLRGGSPAHQPPHRPARRAPQHRGALRPRQRLLRALPRRDDDLLVRDLRGRGRASCRGATAQVAARLRAARAHR